MKHDVHGFMTTGYQTLLLFRFLVKGDDAGFGLGLLIMVSCIDSSICHVGLLVSMAGAPSRAPRLNRAADYRESVIVDTAYVEAPDAPGATAVE